VSVFAKLSNRIIVKYCNDLLEDIAVHRDIDYLVFAFCSMYIMYKYSRYSRLKSSNKELVEPIYSNGGEC
jgi:hypothetical protein